MISIIIPIYNAENEIERMIESIRMQSFEAYEVILIDDGSYDRTGEFCQEIVKLDKRFRYYYQENQGVSAARNYGLKMAQGDYIAFLDADDKIKFNYLEVLLEVCQKSDIAVCDVAFECDGIETLHFVDEEALLNREEALNFLLSRKVINSGPCAKLFRREVIGDIEFPIMRVYEDILFNLSVFSRARAVSVTTQTRYHYIENSQGTMSHMKREVSTDVIVASNRIIQFIKEEKGALCSECLYVTVSHLFQYVLSMVQKQCVWNPVFIKQVKKLYRKFFLDIWKCHAIPIKEKIVFTCFLFGWIYVDKKWIYINDGR